MSTTLNGLYDLEVVTLAEGLRLGRPTQLIMDVDDHRLAYVVVADGAVPDTAVIAHAEAIASIGTDTLALHGLAALDLAFHDQRALELMRRGLVLAGLAVVTDAGEELGEISDVELDAKGAVVSYHVRRSGMGRMLRAHRVLPADVRSVGQVMTVARPASP